jgi:hypothetical protein
MECALKGVGERESGTVAGLKYQVSRPATGIAVYRASYGAD